MENILSVFYCRKIFLCSNNLLKLLICIVILFICKDLFLYTYAREVTPYKLETSLEAIPKINLNFPYIPINFIPPSNQKGVKQSKRIIFRGSKVIFSLSSNLNSDNIFNIASPAPGKDIKVQIIDSNESRFIINNSEIGLFPGNTNFIIYKTEIIPKEVAEGKAILLLLVNNETIGKTTIFVSKTLAEEFNISAENTPFIKSISVINRRRKMSTSRVVKIFVGGKNFFRDILLLENPGVKKNISTQLSLFPSVGFRKIGSKVLIGQEIIKNKYLVKDLTFEGNKFVLIFNPFGILIEKIKVPRCKGRCGESIQLIGT